MAGPPEICLQLVGHGVQPIALEILDAALVHQLGQLRVDGHPGQQGQTVFIGGLLGLALAEGIELLPAVGTSIFLIFRSFEK